jgi:RecA-family ATPase
VEAHRLEQAQQRDFEVKSLQSLMAKRFDPVEWVIPGILPVGLDLLAGRQKIGKSWLTLALAITVATGGYMFGNIKVDEGDVLHLAMEDNERRLHNRYTHGLQEMAPGSGIPKRIDVMERWPRLDAGGLGKLEEWIKSKPNPRLHCRPLGKD